MNSRAFFASKETDMGVNVSAKALMKERATKHENSINQLVLVNFRGVKQVCTTDPNGNLFFWDV